MTMANPQDGQHRQGPGMGNNDGQRSSHVPGTQQPGSYEEAIRNPGLGKVHTPARNADISTERDA